jgi:hypothetical protein
VGTIGWSFNEEVLVLQAARASAGVTQGWEMRLKTLESGDEKSHEKSDLV